ncbi:MAG: transposase, partial [Candidatus Heimdallarchaeota archaeon]|nr:transposase [Candidatus Heimdallarchaeota archaeon]
MTQRNQITTSVKVLINTILLGQKNKQRLRQILGRDSRIISRYIGVIEDNRKDLVEYKEKKNGKISIKIDKGKLDQLTCTTSDRNIVNHDLKTQFPRISLNEMKECRDTAVGMYLSYLELKAKGNASIPTAKSSVPRSIGYRRFKLRYQERTLTIMDSMDTNPSMINNGNKKIHHDKLTLNLDLKNYDICKIMEGSLQAVRIIRSRRNYYAVFAIRHEVKQLTSKYYPKKSNKELAIAGIDLGINRDAVISIITSHGVSRHKFIKLERIENTKQSIFKLDKRIAEIQHKAAKRSTDKEQTDGLYTLLRELRSERSELKYEISHQLSAEINKYLLSLTNQYDLWIGIGKLKGIRRRQRRGNGNKQHRKRMHRWAYGQLTWMLEYKLSKSGYKRRFLT